MPNSEVYNEHQGSEIGFLNNKPFKPDTLVPPALANLEPNYLNGRDLARVAQGVLLVAFLASCASTSSTSPDNLANQAFVVPIVQAAEMPIEAALPINSATPSLSSRTESALVKAEATVQVGAQNSIAAREASLSKETEQGELIYLPVDFGDGTVSPVVPEEYLDRREVAGWEREPGPDEYARSIMPAIVDPSVWEGSAYAYSLQPDGSLVRAGDRDVIRGGSDGQDWIDDGSTQSYIYVPSSAPEIEWPASGFYPIGELSANAGPGVETNRYAIVGLGVRGHGTPDSPKASVMYLRRVADGQ